MTIGSLSSLFSLPDAPPPPAVLLLAEARSREISLYATLLEKEFPPVVSPAALSSALPEDLLLREPLVEDDPPKVEKTPVKPEAVCLAALSPAALPMAEDALALAAETGLVRDPLGLALDTPLALATPADSTSVPSAGGKEERVRPEALPVEEDPLLELPLGVLVNLNLPDLVGLLPRPPAVAAPPLAVEAV